MRRWLLVVMVLVCSSKAESAKLYIAPNGNDSATGSVGAPWKTLDRADNSMSNGDTLYCRGGTYTTTNDFFQSSSSNIVLRSYPGETPVFRTVGRDYYGRVTIMVLQGNGTKLEGLQFIPDSTVAGDIGFQVSGSNCVFDNVTVHAGKLSNGRYVFNQILYLNTANGTEIARCHLSGAGDPTDPHGNTGNVIIGFGDRYNVHDNVMSRGVHDVVRFDGTGSVMRNNTITHSDGYGVFLEYGSHRNLIEHNSITGCDEELNYGKCPVFVKGDSNIVRFNAGWNSEKYGSVVIGKYNRSYNNVYYGNGLDGLGLLPETSGATRNNVFLNNVIAKNMQGSQSCVSYYAEVALFGESDWVASGNQFYKNFIVSYANGGWKSDPTSCAVYSDSAQVPRPVSQMESMFPSLWHDNIVAYSNLMFAAPDNGNFSISLGSCLVDAGAFLTTATSNGTGTSMQVSDPLFFVVGDSIMIGPGTARKITGINYSSKILTLSSSASWSAGANISPYYAGSAPDIGIFELGTSPTPVEIQDYGVSRSSDGVMLTWRLSADALAVLSGIKVQRASSPEGPYGDLTLTPLHPEPAMSFLDTSETTGSEQWYRILLIRSDGSEIIGPTAAAPGLSDTNKVTLGIGSPLASSSVEIRYTLARPGTPVRVSIFAVTGSLVRELKRSVGDPGSYVLNWDTLDQSSRRVARGVYFVELQAGSDHLAKKVVLVRP